MMRARRRLQRRRAREAQRISAASRREPVRCRRLRCGRRVPAPTCRIARRRLRRGGARARPGADRPGCFASSTGTRLPRAAIVRVVREIDEIVDGRGGGCAPPSNAREDVRRAGAVPDPVSNESHRAHRRSLDAIDCCFAKRARSRVVVDVEQREHSRDLGVGRRRDDEPTPIGRCGTRCGGRHRSTRLPRALRCAGERPSQADDGAGEELEHGLVHRDVDVLTGDRRARRGGSRRRSRRACPRSRSGCRRRGATAGWAGPPHRPVMWVRPPKASASVPAPVRDLRRGPSRP